MICAHCAEETTSAEICPRCGERTALADRYQLQAVVGHGAQGTTYRAKRIEDGRAVAVKELLVRKVDRAKALELFEREARVLSQLSHPGIPACYDTLSDDSGRSVSLFLVQEFVEGETLVSELQSRRFDENRVFSLVAEVLDTLHYLGAQRPPVIHRDIKPANIMRRRNDGRLILIDFGSVKAAVDTAEGGSTVAGTFGFMAPEQLMGRAIPASDIYALGATALTLLTRKEPHDLLGEDRQLQIPDGLRLHSGLADVLRWMINETPEARPQDPARLARHIRALLRRQPSALVVPGALDLAAVPPPPRALPEQFTLNHAADDHFKLLFGGIFGGMGVLGAVAAVAVALATGSWALPATMSLFLLIFGGIGGTMVTLGLRGRTDAREIFQQGRVVPGRVFDLSWSFYSINKQRARVVAYSYEVDGKGYDCRHHCWPSTDLAPGDPAIVLYLPRDPSQSILYNASTAAGTERRSPLREKR